MGCLRVIRIFLPTTHLWLTVVLKKKSPRKRYNGIAQKTLTNTFWMQWYIDDSSCFGHLELCTGKLIFGGHWRKSLQRVLYAQMPNAQLPTPKAPLYWIRYVLQSSLNIFDSNSFFVSPGDLCQHIFRRSRQAGFWLAVLVDTVGVPLFLVL